MRFEHVVFTRLYKLILKKFDSVKDFSEISLYNQTTVARKIRGQALFTSADIKAWCDVLEIHKDDIPYYFFEDYERKEEE